MASDHSPSRAGDPLPTPASFPGGEWLLAMFGQLDNRIAGHSKRMDDGFTKLDGKLDDVIREQKAHAVDDAVVERRVLAIEIARQMEAQTVTKRGATAGLFAGGLLMIAWEVVKFLAGHRG